MLDLHQLAAFAAVVRAGSFTKAADALGADKAHVSRLVRRLEGALGAQLLVRSTRSLSVTELGREVYERAVGVFAALEETESAVATARGAPAGTLRITAGEEFGQFVVAHWVAAYAARYPGVKLDLVLTNRLVDVIHEGFDLAVRVGELADSNLNARRLGQIDYALYASGAYLARAGRPRSVEALEKRELVQFSGGASRRIELHRGRERYVVRTAPRIAVNNNAVARDLALRGFGIAQLPRFMADPFVASGDLERVLEGWSRTSVPVHAVYASSRFLAPKVRAFIDVASEAFAASLARAVPGARNSHRLSKP